MFLCTFKYTDGYILGRGSLTKGLSYSILYRDPWHYKDFKNPVKKYRLKVATKEYCTIHLYFYFYIFLPS